MNNNINNNNTDGANAPRGNAISGSRQISGEEIDHLRTASNGAPWEKAPVATSLPASPASAVPAKAEGANFPEVGKVGKAAARDEDEQGMQRRAIAVGGRPEEDARDVPDGRGQSSTLKKVERADDTLLTADVLVDLKGPGVTVRREGAGVSTPLRVQEERRVEQDDDSLTSDEEYVEPSEHESHVEALQRELDRLREAFAAEKRELMQQNDMLRRMQNATGDSLATPIVGNVQQSPFYSSAKAQEMARTQQTSGIAPAPGNSAATSLYDEFLNRTHAGAASSGRVKGTRIINAAQVEKTAKRIEKFAGARLGTDEEMLQSAISFIQDVQDASTTYSWNEAETWIAISSRLTGVARNWFRAYRAAQGGLDWRTFSRDFMLEFSGIRTIVRAQEVFTQERQREDELTSLFISRKELLAALAGIDLTSAAGQTSVVVAVLSRLNARSRDLAAYYTERVGQLSDQAPLRELRRILGEWQHKVDMTSHILGVKRTTEMGALGTADRVSEDDRSGKPRERPTRGCWHCASGQHHSRNCALPKHLRIYGCKYFPSPRWEAEVFPSLPTDLKKRFQKLHNGEWVITEQADEADGKKLRRSVRNQQRKEKKAKAAAAELAAQTSAASPSPSPPAPPQTGAAASTTTIAATTSSSNTTSTTRRTTQQLTFGVLDVLSGFGEAEVGALDRGGHVVSRVILTKRGQDTPVGDEIMASSIALVDTGAAGSVISESFARSIKGAEFEAANDASVFMGGKDAGFRVTVTRVLRTGLFLPMAPMLPSGGFIGLGALKGANWSLVNGRANVLLFVVADGVIPGGADVLIGLDVLSPRDAKGALMVGTWDVLLSKNAICAHASDGKCWYAPMEYRLKQERQPVAMQLLAIDSATGVANTIGSRRSFIDTIAEANLTAEEQMILEDHGVTDELLAWKLGVSRLRLLGLKPFHATKLFTACRARVLQAGTADSAAAAEELRVDETTMAEKELERMLVEGDFVQALRKAGLAHLEEPLLASGVSTLDGLQEALTDENRGSWLEGASSVFSASVVQQLVDMLTTRVRALEIGSAELIGDSEEEREILEVAHAVLEPITEVPDDVEEISSLPDVGEQARLQDEADYLAMVKELQQAIFSEPVRILMEETDPGLTPQVLWNQTEQLLSTHRCTFDSNFVIGDGSDSTRHEVRIKLREGARPVYRKPFRLSQAHGEFVRQSVLENIRLGRMRLLPPDERRGWNATTFAVPKPHSTELRVVTDFRGLNEMVVETGYFSPDSRISLEAIADNLIFAELDCAAGFWQVRIHPDDQHLFATTVEGVGVVCYTVLPMGLKTSSAVYQEIMDITFRDLSGSVESHYIDDVRLHVRTFRQWFASLEELLVAASGVLTFKPRKCHLLVLETHFLGRICSIAGVRMDPSHVQAIQEFPVPTTQKAVRSFCGLANWSGRHVPNFAQLIAPLFDLTKRGVSVVQEWERSDVYEKAFTAVKTALAQACTLALPRWDQTFYLATDASGLAIGAVLYQLEDGIPKPVAFGSRKLLPSQRDRWSTTQKEAFAVVTFCNEFRHYLEGRRFVLHSDHQALIAMFKNVTASAIILRWALRISDLSFDFIYISGSQNVVADALSRMHGDGEMVENSVPRWQLPWTAKFRVVYISRGDKPAGVVPKGAAVIGKEMREATSQQSVVVAALTFGSTAVEQFADLASSSPIFVDLQEKDPLFAAWRARGTRHEMILVGKLSARSKVIFEREKEHMLLRDNILFRTSEREAVSPVPELVGVPLQDPSRAPTPTLLQLVVPKEYRASLLRSKHDDKHAGHRGAKATCQDILLRYWWPELASDVRDYVMACDVCQRTKTPTYRPFDGKLGQLPLTVRPFQLLSVDVLSLSTTRTGNCKWVLAIDHFTGYARVVPVADATARSVALVLYERIFAEFGPPEELLSDNGPEFVAELCWQLCDLFGVSRRFITPYNPRANGKVERANRSFLQTLRAITPLAEHDSWDVYLPAAAYAYNTAPHSTTGFSPFFLLFGREPTDGFDLAMQKLVGVDTVISGDVWIRRLERARRAALDAVLRARTKREEEWKVNHKGVLRRVAGAQDQLVVGQLVMINYPKAKQLADARVEEVGGAPSHHKLQDRLDGPFRILAISPSNAWIRRFEDDKLVGLAKRVSLAWLFPVQGSRRAATSETLDLETIGRDKVLTDNHREEDEPSKEKPATEEEEQEELFVVNKILDFDDEEKRYLVSWKGYDSSYNTWEREKRLHEDVPELIKSFWEQRKKAEQKLRKQIVQGKHEAVDEENLVRLRSKRLVEKAKKHHLATKNVSGGDL